VSGEAPGVLNGMRIYYKKLLADGKTEVLDTSIVMNEKFEFDYQENGDQPEMRFLTMDGNNQNLLFLTSNESVFIKVKKDSFAGSEIVGGEVNKALTQYNDYKNKFQKQVLSLKEQRTAAIKNNDNATVNKLTEKWEQRSEEFKNNATKVFESNTDNIMAAMITGELLNYKQIDESEGRKMFNKMSESVKKQGISVQIDEFLKKTEVTAIGAKAPQFEGLNPEGEVIKLNEVLGKVTLIDFWASWCRPCRMENPNVVAAYEKYHDKGFNIISVSLDRNNGKEAWKKAIIDDNMDWNHISRLQYFGPIAKQYNVSAIPATFLLDENGVIIAKNLRGQDLHNKLAELF
jgi:thiol-disulfide isomerase/thioredoxin